MPKVLDCFQGSFHLANNFFGERTEGKTHRGVFDSINEYICSVIPKMFIYARKGAVSCHINHVICHILNSLSYHLVNKVSRSGNSGRVNKFVPMPIDYFPLCLPSML